MAGFIETGKYDLLKCPFCGFQPDPEDPDTLHKTATFWREDKGLRHYFGRKSSHEPQGQCWSINCNEPSGGCGANISGDSKEETIQAWNRRA